MTQGTDTADVGTEDAPPADTTTDDSTGQGDSAPADDTSQSSSTEAEAPADSTAPDDSATPDDAAPQDGSTVPDDSTGQDSSTAPDEATSSDGSDQSSSTDADTPADTTAQDDTPGQDGSTAPQDQTPSDDANQPSSTDANAPSDAAPSDAAPSDAAPSDAAPNDTAPADSAPAAPAAPSAPSGSATRPVDGKTPAPGDKPGSTSGNYVGTLFSFKPVAGESIGARIVRCCTTALKDGPMGKGQRHDFYRDFIACNQEKTQQAAEALTGVATSCAMFVRAVREWCGAPPLGHYVPGTPMFTSLGNVSLAHPAFVKCVAGGPEPKPGDYFYIASSPDNKNDGHTGIFLSKSADGSWQTAEGGGPPDGTTCRIRTRTISGTKFASAPGEIPDARTLYGWFDCTKVGLPSS